MANKTIPSLPIYGSQDSDKRKKDLIEITKNDGTYASPTYGTGASRKMSVEELKTALDITSQTVTDGITDKSPSENAVFDAVYAKGLINGTIWVNAYTALGDFNLSIDKYNNVGYTDAEGPISVILPTHTASMSGKTIIVEPHRFNSGLTTVNISIPGLQVDGGGGAGTYTEVITKMGQIVTIQANYYGWHVIGHTNQVPDISFKLDLDGSNANQDIDIDGFGVNAKHFKVNGTAGAGHIGFKHQSANISASASESSIGADIVGDPVWKNDGGAIDKLELQSNKTSTVTGNEASTSKYLTVKGVYDWAVGLFAKLTGGQLTGALNEAPTVTIASATTTDIGGANSASVDISGTTTITGFGTVASGVIRNVRFTGALTLTHNATSLILPNATNITTQNGDTAIFRSLGSGNWICVSYKSVSSLTANNLIKFDGSKMANSRVTDNGTTVRFTGINNLLNTTMIEFYNQAGGVGFLNNDGSYQNGKGITVENAGVAKVTILNNGNITTINGSSNSGNTAALQVGNLSGLWAYFNDNRWIQLRTINASASDLALTLQTSDFSSYLWRFYNDGSVHFGTGSKSASAIGQFDSTTKGFLPPRMTNAQRIAIASPAVGLMVYCTDATEGLWINKSTGWTFIA